MNKKLTIFISTPLEAKHVERIRKVDPIRLDVIYEPDLLPETRYQNDHDGLENFFRTPELEERWKQNLSKANILFDFPPKSPGNIGGMDYAPNVKWIQTTSSGAGKKVNDLGFCDLDLLITTARGVHSKPLAEFAFMGILNHIKKFSNLKSEQKKHNWERYCGESLEGKTLGIIGVGRIGRQIAKIGNAFNMRVIGTKLNYKAEETPIIGLDQFYPINQLEKMLNKTDALVICAPDTAKTRKMINKQSFEALKPGAVLINIGRGPIIDEEDMIKALQSGKLNSAYLDVFQSEPLPADSPLWNMQNVTISPHSASTVACENTHIVDIFCFNLECYLENRILEMKNIFDKNQMY